MVYFLLVNAQFLVAGVFVFVGTFTCLLCIVAQFGALTPLEPRLGKKLIEPLTNLIHRSVGEIACAEQEYIGKCSGCCGNVCDSN